MPVANDQGYVEHDGDSRGHGRFAPLQRPEQFNAAMLAFIRKTFL